MSTRNRQSTDLIVVSQTGTHSRQNIGKRTLIRDAQNRGVFSDRGPLGVHFLIRRSGVIEIGRDLSAVGQHGDLSIDEVAVHVQLVGGGSRAGTIEDNFTEKQEHSFANLLYFLWAVYPNAIVAPSSEVLTAEPLAFDVERFLADWFGYEHAARLAEYMARLDTERGRKQEKALEELDQIFGD
tara:strand:+ start:115 stop:663 length:549 start_codon:yes stop_codon:yes gene_type:complete